MVSVAACVFATAEHTHTHPPTRIGRFNFKSVKCKYRWSVKHLRGHSGEQAETKTVQVQMSHIHTCTSIFARTFKLVRTNQNLLAS